MSPLGRSSANREGYLGEFIAQIIPSSPLHGTHAAEGQLGSAEGRAHGDEVRIIPSSTLHGTLLHTAFIKPLCIFVSSYLLLPRGLCIGRQCADGKIGLVLQPLRTFLQPLRTMLRHRYLAQYGCARWTKTALELVARWAS